jgi:hypothetical protein
MSYLLSNYCSKNKYLCNKYKKIATYIPIGGYYLLFNLSIILYETHKLKIELVN